MQPKMDYSRMSNRQLLSAIVSEKSARSLLKRYGDLKEAVIYSTTEELYTVNGISETQATRIKAVAELASRLNKETTNSPDIISSPEDVFKLMADMRQLRVEQFRAIYLNTKNHVLACETISQGTINATVVTPREVFHRAVRLLCCSVILVHNHPSTETNASKEDMEVTERMVGAGKSLGIEVLDHVIIGGGSYFSLKQRGLM